MRATTCVLAQVLLLGCGPKPAAEPSDADTHHARADQAFQTFLIDYWSGYYLTSSVPQSLRVPGYWIFAQAFDLLLDNVERTGGYRGWLETFYEAAEAHGWSRDFFDDENWMVLALMRAYDATGDQKYLTRAVAIFEDIRTQAVDATCCGATPGGLWWDRARTSKATAINGGAVISAVRLSERTGDTSYLELAKSTYDFWTTRMNDTETHQIGDHFGTDGKIVWWVFTYNEGLMIGGALELHRVTGEARYLDDAHRYAGFMLSRETTSTELGPVLHDDGSCEGDCPMFKGIGYRYLARLQQVSPRPEYLAALKASADSAWTIARSSTRAHFGTDWAAPPPTGFLIEADASASMALSAYAALLGPHASSKESGTYEAEEAVLHQVKVAAAREGHSGWGYVTGWSAEGQTIGFDVEVAEAGAYALAFQYLGRDASSRRVSVAGQVAAADLAFPAVDRSTSWGEVSLDVTLPKGVSRVELAFDGAAGSHGTVDLDRLTVRAAR